MKKQLISVVITSLSVFVLQADMTTASLQEAINSAASGATVYLDDDVDLTDTLTVDKDITLSSREGASVKILRNASLSNRSAVTLSSSDADLTLKNLIIDGNSEDGRITASFINIPAGRLTLDSGCSLCNADCSSAGGISIGASGELVMNDGAEIRSFKNSNYGTAVLLGVSGGKFTMNGGIITDCESTSTQGVAAGYGGAVYLLGGTFDMKGGVICGNRSAYNTAGIVLWSGNMSVSGSASITNNVGVANDVFVKSGVGFYLKGGEYAGRFSVYVTEEPQAGTHVPMVWAEGLVSGAGNVCAQGYEDYVADGYTKYENGWMFWRKRIARVGERFVTGVENEAFAKCHDGESVTMLVDRELTTKRTIANKVIVQGEGDGVVLSRGHSDSMFEVVEGGELTFRNIKIDGNKDGFPSVASSLVKVKNGGCCTLGEGTTLRNAHVATCAAAVSVTGLGSLLKLDKGAVICDCETASGDTYGSAVSVESNGTMEMTGGRISGCESSYSGSAGGYVWGGAVYVWNGTLRMTGGCITGNSDERAVGGVTVYSGNIEFGGDAVVEGNPGAYPDVYLNDGKGYASFVGDFRGRVGISSGTGTAGSTIAVARGADNATGAWCFFSTRTSVNLVGTLDAQGNVFWCEASGKIGPWQFVTAEDASVCMSTGIDLDNANPVFSLPYDVSGCACGVVSDVPIRFDVDARIAAGTYPVPLFTTTTDARLGAGWNFQVPSEAGEGFRWKVRSSVKDGEVVYYLDRRKLSGLSVIVR